MNWLVFEQVIINNLLANLFSIKALSHIRLTLSCRTSFVIQSSLSVRLESRITCAKRFSLMSVKYRPSRRAKTLENKFGVGVFIMDLLSSQQTSEPKPTLLCAFDHPSCDLLILSVHSPDSSGPGYLPLHRLNSQF